jgi:hypothetical protein
MWGDSVGDIAGSLSTESINRTLGERWEGTT